MQFSIKLCIFGCFFILHCSMATPLGLARVPNSIATDTVDSSKTSVEQEIPFVQIEISTVPISPVTYEPMETTTSFVTAETTSSNIIDASTITIINNETTTVTVSANVTEPDVAKNETIGPRNKRSCRGFECEQMQQPSQSPPCFGPRCGGYGCGCGFQCTIRFRPCCSPRCQPPPPPPPPPPAPTPPCGNPVCAPICNNNGCIPPPPACRYAQPPQPPACPCPQQPQERPTPAACPCQPSCNIPPPPPPPPPRCGCTPKGCGCIRPPLLPSPISIHINGNMGYPPRMPYGNPCASCDCPAPVCRCPPACQNSNNNRCGPAGCNNMQQAPPTKNSFDNSPDYDYSPNGPRDSDYYDYNGYRNRRSLYSLRNHLGRIPFSKRH